MPPPPDPTLGSVGAIIWLTVVIAAQAIVFGLPIAFGLAVLLRRLFAPLRGALLVAISLPLILPPVVTGWLLLMMFGKNAAIGQYLWQHLRVALPFTTAGAVVACLVMTMPLMVRAMLQGLDMVDPKLLEAANTLGAGPMDRFLSITLPLALPSMVAGVMLAFTACLGEFGAVITFAASIPGETRTLPLAIYAALSQPGGEDLALRLSCYSILLACAGYAVSEFGLRKLRS